MMGRIFRSPWGDFPDVVVQTTVARMQSQPAYRAAKQGNTEAAREVLGPLVKPGKVPWHFDAVIPVTQLPGLRVLIVDDVASFGSTLANLRGWLERQGAVVVGATTLAATLRRHQAEAAGSRSSGAAERLPRVGELAGALGFTPDRFTGREAHYLSGLKQAQDLERLIEFSRALQSGRGPLQVRHDQTARDLPRQPQQGSSRREQPPAPPPHVRYRPPGMDRGPQR
jgi:hypothetical protein